MSFSLWVTVEHEDGYISHFDIVEGQTYNLARMWKRVLIPEGQHISWLDGKPCIPMQPAAIAAVLDYIQNTDAYEALDPKNGWGDHRGFFTKGLLPFAQAVFRHPTGTIHWEG